MRVFTSLILLTACVAFAGVAFGVNPIGPMPESYIGYKIGPVVPALSFNFFNVSGSFEYRDVDFDEEYSGRGSASIISPALSTKFLIGSSDLQPFIRLSAGMPLLLSVNVELDLDDPDYEDEIDSIIDVAKDGLDATLVFAGGAGIEYFFAEKFSIGGEFKYGFVIAGGDWEVYENEFIDVKGSIGRTSTGLWLNYYFQ